ncbi:hypothetical protein [Sphingobium bisphenolivorans]|uniref:hypothetical protein n=1 Tax=Sphingobium bisphenolivorans TaxID=1335760 RepID=UPI00039B083A|nr:hypothetical protein [Sphingobium bisphenolivorans]
MSLLLLATFLAACVVGLSVGLWTPLTRGGAVHAVLPILASALLIGALIVAAEAGSARARTLALAAVLAGSAALCGSFAVARRMAGGEARQ